MENINTEENIQTEDNIQILDVLQQMPNEAIKEFFIKKLNGQIQTCQETLISLFNKIKETEPNGTSATITVQECIGDIIEVENSKWTNLSDKNIINKINFISKSFESASEQLGVKEEVEKLIENTNSWLEVERNFTITTPDHYYSLYKYIHPENVQELVLNELTELYKEMF